MRTFNRLVSISIHVCLAIVIVTASANVDEYITSRTSNVHSVYSSDADSGGEDHIVHDQVESQQTNPSGAGLDWAGDSNPYSRNNKKFNDDTDGSFYHYPQPEVKNYDGSPYKSEIQRYRPSSSIQNKEYGYSRPNKHKGKGKDHLWQFFEHFFDKKQKLEDELWSLILSKGHHKGYPEHQPEYGHYGEPPSDYHDHKLSKEEVFKKIKLLAIAATILLIVLGGGILLAPLAIGKGRRRSLSEFLQPHNVGAAEMGQLAGSVLQAIQHYQQLQTN